MKMKYNSNKKCEYLIEVSYWQDDTVDKLQTCSQSFLTYIIIDGKKEYIDPNKLPTDVYSDIKDEMLEIYKRQEKILEKRRLKRVIKL